MTADLVGLADRLDSTLRKLRERGERTETQMLVGKVHLLLANELEPLFTEAATELRALAGAEVGGFDDDGPVFSGRKIRFDYLAEKLLPVALGGHNCAGPQDWRIKESIRAVLCHLYPSNIPTNDEER